MPAESSQFRYDYDFRAAFVSHAAGLFFLKNSKLAYERESKCSWIGG